MTLAATLLVALVSASSPTATSAGTCPVDTTPDFTDNCYHEYLLYNIDQAEIDVLILPSASPYYLRDAVVLEQSVKMWDDGINALGPAWLASGLNIHWYTVGLDAIPTEALWDPEVVIITGEVNPVLLAGIGQQTPYSWCHGLPPPALDVSAPLLGDLAERLASQEAFHQHPGSDWGMLSAECDGGGRTCFVINTNFLMVPNIWFTVAENRRDMFDLNSHEFGHCIGIGHVGDALDFSANAYPRDDIMSYESDGHDPGRVLCVSTLNIKALEYTYGYLLGQSGYPSSTAGGFVHQDPTAWSDDQNPSVAGTQLCPEPTASYTDLTPLLTADPLGI